MTITTKIFIMSYEYGTTWAHCMGNRRLLFLFLFFWDMHDGVDGHHGGFWQR